MAFFPSKPDRVLKYKDRELETTEAPEELKDALKDGYLEHASGSDKLPPIGMRRRLKLFVDGLANRLEKRFPEIGFQNWNGESIINFCLMTTKSTITSRSNIEFEVSRDFPFQPMVEQEDGKLSFTFYSWVGVSGNGDKISGTKEMFQEKKDELLKLGADMGCEIEEKETVIRFHFGEITGTEDELGQKIEDIVSGFLNLFEGRLKD